MRPWVFAVLAATAVLIAGCGSDEPSSAPATAADDGAYQAFKDAGKVFDCSKAYDQIRGAGGKTEFDVKAVRQAAAQYRDINVKYTEALNKIDFPASAKPIAEELHRATAAEIVDLEWLTAISTPRVGYQIINDVFYDEAAIFEVIGRLKASLGHPGSQASTALDQFELARQTAQKDNPRITELFDAAIAQSDLDAAKTANRIQEDLLQRYIDTLDTIDFPDGFDARVDDLRSTIRASIDFDRRQVDVTDTTKIVKAPPEGTPSFLAQEKAATELDDALVKAADAASTEPASDPKC